MMKYSTYRSIYKETPEVSSNKRSIASLKNMNRVIMKLNLMKVLMVFVLVVSGLTVVGNVFAGSATEIKQEKQIVVEPGDTLWEIASSHKPSDMRTVVYIEAIKESSGLDRSEIQAGDILSLPIY
jgi:LysM repeat protein